METQGALLGDRKMEMLQMEVGCTESCGDQLRSVWQVLVCAGEAGPCTSGLCR